MLTMAYKGGRGVWTPPFLADIICEQPLIGEILSMLFSAMALIERCLPTLWNKFESKLEYT